jgi:Flp pilus assembly protein TadG
VPHPIPRLSRRRSNRGRGQALTEFALVIPVFLLVLSAILDFGFMLYSRMTVINAAREGARAAVIYPDPTQIPTVAAQRAQSAAQQAGLTISTSNVSAGCVATKSASCDFATKTGSQPGDSVRVRVTYQYKSFFPLLFGTTFDLTSTVQMVLE